MFHEIISQVDSSQCTNAMKLFAREITKRTAFEVKVWCADKRDNALSDAENAVVTYHVEFEYEDRQPISVDERQCLEGRIGPKLIVHDNSEQAVRLYARMIQSLARNQVAAEAMVSDILRLEACNTN